MINTNRVLVLGATGMLGHSLFAELSKNGDLDVHATARNTAELSGFFSSGLMEKIRGGVDADNFDTVVRAVAETRPGVVINCIGLIKHLPVAADPIPAISINALFPHRLASLCAASDARLIHVSTDCVFSGSRGMYTEEDVPDATDLYGRTKHLGEVVYPHCLTLRTSIIGHELRQKYGLIEWFLARTGKVSGYTKAIFSGLPTVELARVIAAHIIPATGLSGLFHLSSEPISKYNLLRLVSRKYDRNIEIEPNDDLRIDRSLDSTRFRHQTGYSPPPWEDLIASMYNDYRAYMRCRT